MTIKIALTVAILCGVTAWVMMVADKDNRYTNRSENYPLVGGFLMLVTIAAIVVAMIAGLWDI